MPDILRLTDFAPRELRNGESFDMDLNVLPGTVWRVISRGPGTLNRGELQDALNEGLAERLEGGFEALRGSTGEFEYDCGRRTLIRGAVTMRQYDFVDATQFGDRYARRLLPGGPPRRDVAEATREAEKRRHRDAANKRARETLDRMLTQEQRLELKKQRRFHITGSEGNRYRLTLDSCSGNVWWVNKSGVTRGQYCAHPRMTGRDLAGKDGIIPIADAVIAQKLMLETDEPGFLGMANLFNGEFPPGVTRRYPERDRFPAAAGAFAGCGCGGCEAARRRQVAVD